MIDDDWEDQSTQVASVMDPLPLSREASPHHLELARGPGAPQTFDLGDRDTVIGRSTEADIHIPSVNLSRKHLLLQNHGPEYGIKDMNSRNGVFLNGVKVSSAVLREGDAIQLGDVVLIYHEGR